jgi:regulator of replication initiation timing
MIPLPSYSMIVELIKKGATIEAQEQIMKLREAALELQEENLALREENKRLREEKELATNLEFSDGVYWLHKDGKPTGPFCSACYDEHHRLSRPHDGSNYIAIRWICVVCSRRFR